MLYPDTSAIVKLYVKEELSKEVGTWIKQNNEALPLTSFHDLEFNNALRLKQFRGEITEKDVGRIISKFTSHQRLGIFYRPQINWPEIFEHAVKLSNLHTKSTGARSLDVLHVAAALSFNAERFLTFDAKQANLVSRAKIKLVTISKCS